jgi:hypothetical protein
MSMQVIPDGLLHGLRDLRNFINQAVNSPVWAEVSRASLDRGQSRYAGTYDSKPRAAENDSQS